MIGYQKVAIADVEWMRSGRVMTAMLPQQSVGKDFISSVSKFVRRNNLLLARWEKSFELSVPSEWWHVVKDQFEDFNSLGKKLRYSIRKGWKKFDAFPVEKTFVKEQCYSVYSKAFARYSNAGTPLEYKQFNAAIEQLPSGTEFWAVREKGNREIVGLSENFVTANVCRFVTMWHNPVSIKEHSGYVLVQEMDKHYLEERRVNYITNGVRNIHHDTKIHDFLEQKFGYRKAYCELGLSYHPLVKPIVASLFPLRWKLHSDHGRIVEKISVLLELERIRRSFGKVGEP